MSSSAQPPAPAPAKGEEAAPNVTIPEVASEKKQPADDEPLIVTPTAAAAGEDPSQLPPPNLSPAEAAAAAVAGDDSSVNSTPIFSPKKSTTSTTATPADIGIVVGNSAGEPIPLTPRQAIRKPITIHQLERKFSTSGIGIGGPGIGLHLSGSTSQQTTPTQTPKPLNQLLLAGESLLAESNAAASPPQPPPPTPPPLRSLSLPRPRHPSECPLYCAFYAEFDNRVGPQVCFQSPIGFLDQQIDLPLSRVHAILSETFKTLREKEKNGTATAAASTAHKTPKTSNSKTTTRTQAAAALPLFPTAPISFLPVDPQQPQQQEKSSADDTIFDSCSEFIITGHELTGNIINLSTHHIHVLTRPTMISDERYERNSLLFSVGFILRRTEDPRPFRPVLSKLALTLRDMELESQFLSAPSTRSQIQSHLETVLVCLNSRTGEGNLSLTAANVLNLKLFHPPKLPAPPVPEHAVPILLRRDRHMYMYDWDLAINWVSLHIDGITNARQISFKAEIDMEMVLACLRVLLHHGVIALVDMFFFTNRYEPTEKAAALLAGNDPDLLRAAVDFAARRPLRGASQHMSELSPSQHSRASTGAGTSPVPFPDDDECRGLEPRYYATATSFPPPPDREPFSGSGIGSGSYKQPHRQGSAGAAAASSIRTNASPQDYAQHHRHHHHHHRQSSQSPPPRAGQQQQREEKAELRVAIAELYCACNRNTSIGELWVNLISERHSVRTHPSLDWKKVFQNVDHRRVTSFGLVHGLIRRVHNFPMIVNADFTEGEKKIIALAADEWERQHAGGTVRGRSQGGRSQHHHLRNHSPGHLQQSAGATKQDSTSAQHQHQHQHQQRTRALKLAHMMDGRHCDDELVCRFEKPLTELIEMVDQERHVVNTYAPATSY